MIRPAATGVCMGMLLLAALLAMRVPPAADQNLVADPSFEATGPRDRFGRVFPKWEGSRLEGDCSFDVGLVSHSGKTSALLACSTPGKIRIAQQQRLAAGRYRIVAYLRGLEIGTGQWNLTTEFMFNGKYFNLPKNGTFGWTRLTYVADLAEPATTGPSFGLWAPGMFWIDDVSMERVGGGVMPTSSPVLEGGDKPIRPPAPLGPGAVRCPRCGYRNMPGWEKCFACGTQLQQGGAASSVSGPPVRVIASFENGNPFESGAVVAEHATDGQKALRIDRGYAVMQASQNWQGYDFLKADTYTDSPQPLTLGVEIQDSGTTDYWTRVNLQTVVPPGRSTLILPLKQLYVGEKGRPGRNLILGGIRRLVFAIGNAPAPLYLDNLRLERDSSSAGVFFDGLHAFDFGTGSSPVMDGFTAITPATVYNPGRGYGLKNAKIWRAFDALQPDPLYQDFICIESGGLAVDVPNGRYHVVVNMDSPGGFWGEVQAFRERSIVVNGRRVVSEKMDFKSFARRYFQFWDRDDLPSEDTFDKYDPAHFSLKAFDANVTNGQLNLVFEGQNWACSVSAVIIFPAENAAEGERFLKWVTEKRRFYFDHSFKRVLHHAAGDPLAPSAEDTKRGYVLFSRDYMEDLYPNDTPRRDEIGRPLSAEGFAGQQEPVTLAVAPLADLGQCAVSVSALSGSQGEAIPAAAVDIGYVSYRNTRITSDGAVYTIAPRFIMPSRNTAIRRGVARQYWLNVRVPAAARPGIYSGQVTFTPEHGVSSSVPLRFTVRKGVLAPVDIPVGPFGGPIRVPWLEDDPQTAAFSAAATENSLRDLRVRGFTMFSGVPYIRYQGFRDGKPQLDFTAADRQMRTVKEAGFLAASSYGAGVIGLDAYRQDTAKMKEAGFSDYSAFIKTIYSAILQHAREKAWPEVYWNLCDEPGGEDLKLAIENAKAYRAAFPAGPPFFTGATSLYEQDPEGLHFTLAETLHVPAFNIHDEAGVRRLLSRGGAWAFYNGGSRWTFGEYLYKAVAFFRLKYRLAWHWNAAAGDPYYALDSREDDYAWANAGPAGQLAPSLEYLRIAAGLNDYRYLLTLARLAQGKPGTSAAFGAAKLIARRMAAFRIGDRDRTVEPRDWRAFRQEIGAAIEAFQ